LAVVNGTLMAIGGFDGTTYLKTCEIYDLEANVWKLSGSMIYRRLGGGVGVVKPKKDNNSANTSKNCATYLISIYLAFQFSNKIIYQNYISIIKTKLQVQINQFNVPYHL
jgi:hypothetical protein